MEEFVLYSPEEVINRNLRESALRFEGICRQDLSHLQDLAHEIADSAEEGAAFLASLPDHVPDSFSEPLSEGANKTTEKEQRLRSLCLKALLAIRLQQVLSERTPLTASFFFGEPSELRAEAAGRVSYQKSSFSDDAYLCFAEHFEGLHSSYASGFAQACEEVYNGLSEYCMLPIASASEGQLNGFFRLIDRYDLKIFATCTVTESDPAKRTCFALLQRDLIPAPHRAGEQRELSLILPQGSEPDAADLLLAARLCGLELRGLDSVLPTEMGDPLSLRYTFTVGEAGLSAFLLYLAMDAPHYRPIGIYSRLNP
ncbi:MAG: hypothetical protein II369_06590 [Clostridia bacterium]|jgi:hypothetical protein|nr:hypothetical protein [Clostridia bacterium]